MSAATQKGRRLPGQTPTSGGEEGAATREADNASPVVSPANAGATTDDFFCHKLGLIERHLADEVDDTALHRVEAGRAVLAIQSDAKYGQAGVKKAAKQLKVSAASLYRLASVAEAFSDADLAAAHRLAVSARYQISFSLLAELILAPPEQRTQLLQRAIEQNWTVQRARRELREANAKRVVTAGIPSLGAATALADQLFAQLAGVTGLAVFGSPLREDTAACIGTLGTLGRILNEEVLPALRGALKRADAMSSPTPQSEMGADS